MEYYLTNGIYHSWVTVMKTIISPQENKKKYFDDCQKSARKDVEHAFEVLQDRFAIVRGPASYCNFKVLKDFIYACIILHNMIIEHVRHLYLKADQFIYKQLDDTLNEPISHNNIPKFMEFIVQHPRIRDRDTHNQLQANLIEHLFTHGHS